MGHMLIASQWILYFVIYSFIGWIWEVLYVRVTEHRWNNQGFLAGPYLPIYGFGAVVAIALVAPLEVDPFWKFVLCGVMATVAEYATHFGLEKLFGMRLWDYSKYPLNIRGRVCLFASLAFATMALFVIDIVHPLVMAAVGWLPGLVAIILAAVMVVVLVSEFSNSLAAATSFRRETLHGELRKLRRWTINRLQKAFPNLRHK